MSNFYNYKFYTPNKSSKDRLLKHLEYLNESGHDFWINPYFESAVDHTLDTPSKEIEKSSEKQSYIFDSTNLDWVKDIIQNIFLSNSEHSEIDQESTPSKKSDIDKKHIYYPSEHKFSGNKKEFITVFKPIADKIETEHGINSDFILAQIGLETGWGKSLHGNNVGNIKVGSNWKGKYNVFKDDGPNDRFRVYDSLEQGLNDYVRLLLTPRYKEIVGKDAYETARIVKKKGYATDPNYVSKIHNIVKKLYT